jgi:hypothetical protein
METCTFFKALFFSFAAAAALLTAGCRGKTDDGSASTALLPVWEPDAKLLDDLGAVTAVDAYEVRPPKGYSLNPPAPNATQGMRAFYWKGTPRSDSSYAYFMIVLKSADAGEAKERTLEKELSELLEGFHRQRSNWTQTSPERGQVNGLTFVRAHFGGDKEGKRDGFMYVAKDGSTVIQITSQDAEPHHEHALKLAEGRINRDPNHQSGCRAAPRARPETRGGGRPDVPEEVNANIKRSESFGGEGMPIATGSGRV